MRKNVFKDANNNLGAGGIVTPLMYVAEGPLCCSIHVTVCVVVREVFSRG